jgi:hypothetical protein
VTLDYHKPEPRRGQQIRWPFRIMAGILGAAPLLSATIAIIQLPREFSTYALVLFLLGMAGACIYIAAVGRV